MVEYSEDVKKRIEAGTSIPLHLEFLLPGACPNCRGLGVVYTYELAPGYTSPSQQPHPTIKTKWMTVNGKSGWWRGKTVETPCPACNKGEINRDWLRVKSGLDEKDYELTITSFQVSGKLASKAAARQAIANELHLGKAASGILTLWGGYGVGKTHLLKAAVNGLIGQGVAARYILLPDWIADLRSHFDKGSAEVERRIQDTNEVTALAIDEMDPDRINLTDWVKEVLFRVIDTRYQNKGQLLTILATNLDPAAYPPELGYLADRMQEGAIVEVGGPSMRPVKRYAEERVQAMMERKDVE